MLFAEVQGFLLSFRDGFFDDFLLGFREGFFDGFLLGFRYGFLLGFRYGFLLGFFDDFVLGFCDGYLLDFLCIVVELSKQFYLFLHTHSNSNFQHVPVF